MAAIYVIGANGGPKKIGIAKNPKSRLSSIRSHNVSQVDILHVREIGDEAWKVEGHAHRLLRPHHVRGEWFDVTLESAIAAISAAMECVADGETIGRTVGRKKQFEERITLPLSAAMLAQIDSSLENGEVRLDLIRSAIEREIKRRAKSKRTED